MSVPAPPLPPRRSTSTTDITKMNNGVNEGSNVNNNGRIKAQVESNYAVFVGEVDPKDVLDLLIQKKIVSIERKDVFMSKATRKEQCRALLDHLLISTNDKAFAVLREALDDAYQSLGQRIDATAVTAAAAAGAAYSSLEDSVPIYPENYTPVSERVKFLEHPTLIVEKRPHLLEERLLKENDKLTMKKGRLKKDLEIAQKELGRSRQNEALLQWKLEEANRRIEELERSFQKSIDNEEHLERQVSILEQQMTIATERESRRQQNHDGLLFVPAPPLPPRRSTSTTDVTKMNNGEPTACFSLKHLEINCAELQLVNLLETTPKCEKWAGTWRGTEKVNVKKMIVHNLNNSADFFNEAQILHKLSHATIVKLKGICSLADPLYVVTESLSNGRLYDFLRTDKGETVQLKELIDIARQIADGMNYLGSCNRYSILHRDLRLANILYGDGNVVKISNFELSLDFNDANRVKDDKTKSSEFKFPIRWTAPEAITECKWSYKSDVWSFGFLLYEMFTYGLVIPYQGKRNEEVCSLILTKYRLPRPTGQNIDCPDTVHLTMLWCWDSDPDARPTFAQLERYFAEFFNDTKIGCTEVELLPRPLLVGMIKGDTAIRGMTILDGWLYVVRFSSSLVEIYNCNDGCDFKRSKKSILIVSPGQKPKRGFLDKLTSRKKKEHLSSGVQDIASCSVNMSLYASDWQNSCVHRIDPSKKEISHSWTVEGGEPWGISTTVQGNVIVSCGNSNSICEYSTDGVLIRTIDLGMVDDGPWHAVQILSNRWVLCHGERYYGAGEVCVVDYDGTYASGYEVAAMHGASHLAALSSGEILLAESDRDRIVLMHPSLRGPVREILNPDHGIMKPTRLHLCESSGRLLIGLVDGSVLIYQILHSDQ